MPGLGGGGNKDKLTKGHTISPLEEGTVVQAGDSTGLCPSKSAERTGVPPRVPSTTYVFKKMTSYDSKHLELNISTRALVSLRSPPNLRKGSSHLPRSQASSSTCYFFLFFEFDVVPAAVLVNAGDPLRLEKQRSLCPSEGAPPQPAPCLGFSGKSREAPS